MKTAFILAFILLLLSFHSNAQQTIDKLNVNQLKLPKESTNKALILDGAGQVKSSSTITDTELGYLEGLSDTLVNLLSGKANDSDVVKLSGNQSVDGIKTFTGKLVASSTVNGSIPCPVMTEAQRDLFTPVEGDCVYNSDTLKLNVFDGSVWKDVGGAGGISLWLTANPYNVNDIVIESDKIYRCLIAHTSGTFATDLAAAKWGEVSASPVVPYSLANGGTNKALTAVNGGIVWVDADSFEILTAGVLGQVLQSNGAGAPSWVNKSISAKAENGSSVTAEELQVSNNQLTQVDTNKHLIESGNNNLLINPSFEHSTFSTGWTNSAGTFTEETVVEIHGKKAAKLVLSSQTMALTQDSSLYAAQFADGVQGLASVRIKSDVALKVCSRSAGVTSSSLCVDVQANNKWGLYKVPFILGATSNGISIASTGNVTGTVYIDDAFVGAVDLKQDINTVSDWVSFTPVWSSTGTQPSIGNGTITGKYRRVGDSVEVFTEVYSGSTTSYGTGSYNFSMPTGLNIDPSKIATSGDRTVLGVSALFGSRPYNADVTYNGGLSQQVSASLHTSATLGGRISNTFPETWTNVGNLNSFSLSYKYPVLEWGSSSSVYSSTNADTDWASCNFATLAWQGLGTVTSSLKCKRQGSELLIEGSFVSGTTSASEARIPLPIWNGLQLSTSNSQIIPSIGKYGDTIRDSALLNIVKRNIVIVEPSVNYLNFGQDDYSSNTNPFSKLNGSSILLNNQKMSINARIPIEGWQNSNIIIGQFNGLESCTDSYECTDTFSAKVSAAGVVSDQNIDWLNGSCTRSGTNSAAFSCSFKSGVFTVAPNCTATLLDTTSEIGSIAIISSTSGIVGNTNANGAYAQKAFQVICQKQGVDYIGKTAKAVASDQNLRSQGLTRAVVNSCEWTSAGAFNNSIMCNAGFSSMSKPATGRYQLNFRTTQSNNPVCTTSNLNVGADRMCNIYSISTSAVTVQCENSSAGTDLDVPGLVICHGVSP